MTDHQGQRFDNYRLIRLLGTGNFGKVYLAKHIYRQTDVPVAIKVLSSLSQDDLQTFLAEARTFRLKHPNIVQILDFGIERHIPFLVMEYAPNGTLRQRHPKGTCIPLPTIISYVKQIASALQYAHDERLVHRDIKPENMLIGEQNQILLSDFGLATMIRSISSQSGEQIAGTIPYMAPEQMQSHWFPASDQYALGVVVYEWLCGERPFQGSFTEIAVKHATVPPPPLHKKMPTIMPDVEQVVLTALAKDPGQRFDSVLAFAIALEQACSNTLEYMTQPIQPGPFEDEAQSMQSDLFEHESQPMQSEPVAVPVSDPLQEQRTPSAIESTHKLTQPRTSRRKMVAGLGTGLLVGAGSLTWLVLSHRLHIPSVFGPTPIPLGRLLYTYPGHNAFVNAAAWSPDGKRIASGSSDKMVQVWDAVNGGNVYTYSHHSDLVEAVAWSPDGKRIASGSFDETVQVWNAANGGNPLTYRGHNGYVNAVAWSHDGKHIASGSSDGTVQVWDASNGNPIFIYHGHSKNAVHAVAWLPDGKRIASGSLDKTVQVWNATDGSNVYTYKGHSKAVYTVSWSSDGKHIASGSLDKTVQVWNAADGSNVYTYKGHSQTVYTVSWSHNGKRIASGGTDNTVQIWDAADGNHVFIHKYSAEVRTVAWSPDDRRIASAGDDTTVQVWVAG